MKRVLILSFFLLSYCTHGQIDTVKLAGIKVGQTQRYHATDTIPKVIYLTDKIKKNEPDYFLNNEKTQGQALQTIDPNHISNMTIEKKEGTNGSVYVTLKDYQPHFLSLNALKKKYIRDQNSPTLFLINDKIISADYDKYLVDEKYILKIEVETIINEKEGVNLRIIKLITRTEENLKKANTIILRGEE